MMYDKCHSFMLEQCREVPKICGLKMTMQLQLFRFPFFFFFLLLLLSQLLLEIMAAATVPALRRPIGVRGDTMTPCATLADGDILVSRRGTFALGFFSPGNSRTRYMGVWYFGLPVQTVVWVANRAAPLNTSSAVLKLTSDGNIVLVDDSDDDNNNNNSVLWSSGTSNVTNPVLQLLDSGNLILTKDGHKDILWQSFDHPCDTYLPGMKIGMNFRNNVSIHLTSWKSVDDPSPGDYHYKTEASIVPELFTWKGSTRVFRSGPWNEGGSYDNRHTGAGDIFRSEFVSNQNEIYHSVKTINASVRARMVLDSTGVLHEAIWSNEKNGWVVLAQSPTDPCDNYTKCGVNSICSPTYTPVCQCLHGFASKSKNWDNGDYSDGCARNVSLNCPSDGFLILKSVKLPDNLNAAIDRSKTQDDCRDWCLRNCSCMAYAVTSNSGCLIWIGDLRDIGILKGGNDLYFRLAASELDNQGSSTRNTNSSKKSSLAIIIAVAAVVTILLVAALLLYFRNRRRRYHGINPSKRSRGKMTNISTGDKDELELPLFDMLTIKSATDDFSFDKLLGEGGFGPVYKGHLVDGEIAVKRLSKDSIQGLDEFKTEVSLIAKLQHKNLVRLLGCCIDEEERILIYEYMQNTSLDCFIFDKEKARLLDWKKRLEIIIGIARGLLYLHRDSRLKIIHRDMKTGNILLDEQMNPKISDFGMARILREDHIEEKTMRVVGTYGYMSPEYAMYGKFSEKSDVFSFGVIVLEILSGKKNRVVTQANHPLNLLGHAWRLWKEGRYSELLDSVVEVSHPISDVLRCIQIGLLCVQEKAEDRPNMADVVLMLASESVPLHQPKQPGFCVARTPKEGDSSTSNEITMTMLEGR